MWIERQPPELKVVGSSPAYVNCKPLCGKELWLLVCKGRVAMKGRIIIICSSILIIFFYIINTINIIKNAEQIYYSPKNKYLLISTKKEPIMSFGSGNREFRLNVKVY